MGAPSGESHRSQDLGARLRGSIIRWGVIGCGDVVERKSGPALQLARDSALTAVMCRTESRVRDFAHRHGVPRWTTRIDELLTADDVDAVYVATPPDAHAEMVTRAAAAGKPVLVEKPMGRSPAESEAMVDACRRAGVPLFVAYYRRHLPRFQELRSRLPGLGRLCTVSIALHRRPEARDHWRWNPEVAGGGRFVDLGCHQLDFLDQCLGPALEAVGRTAGAGPAEDTVAAVLRFPGDVLVNGSWCFEAQEFLDRVEFRGTRGSLSFSFFQREDPPHVHLHLVQAVVDELLGRSRCDSTGDSALRTDRVIDAILAERRRPAPP